ncbi:RNA polymerase sigma factor [Dinghuibacter silviterrae]|uniref:hypothetical protein n=1 Tax=Dinghuibacter silviterrae TaxID=1539049 RepID=UPI0010645389|nr:hypothetical protein [Dinghuibacter silviterrae]
MPFQFSHIFQNATDGRLVRRLKNGDFQAYGILIRKYQYFVNSTAYKLTLDKAAGYNLAVESMLALWNFRAAIPKSSGIRQKGFLEFLRELIRFYFLLNRRHGVTD